MPAGEYWTCYQAGDPAGPRLLTTAPTPDDPDPDPDRALVDAINRVCDAINRVCDAIDRIHHEPSTVDRDPRDTITRWQDHEPFRYIDP